MNPEDKVTYFAETDARNKRVKFGIKAKDRSRHVYIIGKTGMGKSTLLENMAVQDIQNGEGMAFIDPHGKTAELLLEYIPETRIDDVIYFAPFDVEHPISFNVLESVDPDKRHLVVSGLMSTFKKIWQDAWSARMEYILTNTLLALLEYPDSTLLGVNRMLSDKEYRKKVVDNVRDVSVKAFWTEEFANYTERMAAEAVPAIQNKIGQFTANPLIRNIIGQPKSTFDFRKAMDTKKILIINLSKGRIGDVNTNLLGGMLITKIYLAAMSRADVSDRVIKLLPQINLFVDEFQNFANESFADILSEARKYKLSLTIAHQYIEQMEEEVRAAVFGNIGTMITFRVGAYDAEVLEKEFAPTFELEDIVNLGFAQIYLKLMIDGVTSQPFSATTLPPIPLAPISYKERVIKRSQEQFSQERSMVERVINDWHKPLTPPKGNGGNRREVGERPRVIQPIQQPKPIVQSQTMSVAKQNTNLITNPIIKLDINSDIKSEKKIDSKPEIRSEDKLDQQQNTPFKAVLGNLISENPNTDEPPKEALEHMLRLSQNRPKQHQSKSPEKINSTVHKADLKKALEELVKKKPQVHTDMNMSKTEVPVSKDKIAEPRTSQDRRGSTSVSETPEVPREVLENILKDN